MNDINRTNDSLVRVYEVLKLTPVEIKKTINDLAQVQQVAVTAELMKSLSEDEVGIIGKLGQKSDEEKKAAMEQIAKAHAGDDNFKNVAQALAKKVIDEHIAYLKTRGDEAQKAEIAKILAEIG